ncbi:leucine--tRNA ligase [Aquimarina sp. ERC-38]|uniref:leucine--tRNA ligase n=1 Tax=Aquimarina sp. ERC-38 TaxID=2949996 RepID=UPI002247B020|nr:class I tRNA ligase family protein [Aquimarina sp. ERC-38]UZO82647.1 leucine--tRNA ligase [Aquimarina sp. ERC-38]
MSYDFREIESKWQKYWAKHQIFKAENQSEKEKFYVLDMFPYPSGAGLHVGHPLGYIASDIYARYKRHQGFNVLHPQGYDSFGLPAEQYAIQTGQHPAVTTRENIARYREQLDKIGFSFDWSREVKTSDPEYYKWTQWIFIQLFDSWYDNTTDKARPIAELITVFKKEGNTTVNAVCDENISKFPAEEWNQYTEKEQQQLLLKYRLTYLAETEVNWCPQLGTVLANDEIVNGVSERGGYPVVRKKMTQWSMRITAYAERLLQDLQTIDWPQPLKDSQTNWIGKSVGALVKFRVMSDELSNSELLTPHSKLEIEVFTTRPDTIFGVTFMTLAPEHELVAKITTPEQKEAVEAYVEATAKRSERERMADVKTISGVFTGAYAEHPFTKKPVPIWIGDYVLAGYGTGAVMAVPCGDQRDYDFANHFKNQPGMPPIFNIFKDVDISKEAYTDKQNTIITNSDFLDDLDYKEANRVAIETLKVLGQGERQINYRLRDAVFSRQRYWGEPFPVYYVDGMPQMIAKEHLPIKLPEIEKYLPTETGEPPLGRAKEWYWLEKDGTGKIVSKKEFENISSPDRKGGALELNTMPGWAGSSWYLFRYMDPKNVNEIASKEALDYWQNVDLYIGGSEHATGHLLYSRFWTKFLYDREIVPVREPFKKLINQGMILGESAFIHQIGVNFGGFINPELKLSTEDNKKLETLRNKYNIIENRLYSYDLMKIFRKHYNKPRNKEEIQHNYIREKLTTKVQNLVSKEVKEMNLKGKIMITSFKYYKIHVDTSLLKGTTNALDIEAFRLWRPEFKNAEFILDNGEIYKEIDSSPSGRPGGDFIVSREVEKMSKSKYNVVNPDDICEQYGADTLRLYEMFLGPLEQAKPWNTAGITGVHNFLKKLWKLYHSGEKGSFYTIDTTIAEEKEGAKILHKTIKKVQDDIENFSFNTSVSTFMIAVNELTAAKCYSKSVLEPLLILLSPYAPHISEELWSKFGHQQSIATAPFPIYDAKFVQESTKTYPVSFNGKKRFEMELSLDLTKDQIEAAVMQHEKTQQQLSGRAPKKVIIVPGKIVNIVG